MQDFTNSVPFDPGYSKMSFSFLGDIDVLVDEYSKLKANHQKKFWLVKNEPSIITFIEKCTAFYCGCLLWGSFIYYRFLDESKKIEGNNTDKMSKEELQDYDSAYEVKAIIDYINFLDRDFKYFVKRPFKISEQIKNILKNYVEFASLNNNFVGIVETSQIKIPKTYEKISKYKKEQLDELCEKIFEVINSLKIEKLLLIEI